jgi:hypothetical protein
MSKWVSVKKRRPPKLNKKGTLNYVKVKRKNGETAIAYHAYSFWCDNEFWLDLSYADGNTFLRITDVKKWKPL